MKYKLKGPNKKCVPKKKVQMDSFPKSNKKSPNKNVTPIKKSSKPHLSSSFFPFSLEGKQKKTEHKVIPVLSHFGQQVDRFPTSLACGRASGLGTPTSQ